MDLTEEVRLNLLIKFITIFQASASTSGTQMIEPSQNLNVSFFTKKLNISIQKKSFSFKEVEMEDDERQSYSKNDLRCYFKRI